MMQAYHFHPDTRQQIERIEREGKQHSWDVYAEACGMTRAGMYQAWRVHARKTSCPRLPPENRGPRKIPRDASRIDDHQRRIPLEERLESTFTRWHEGGRDLTYREVADYHRTHPRCVERLWRKYCGWYDLDPDAGWRAVQ